MAKKSALEEALEHLINEDEDKAVEAFHNFVVQKARAIHEELIADDEVDEDIDESLNLESTVDETSAEEVDENVADASHEVDSDEYYNSDDMTTEDDMDDEADMDDDEAEMDLDGEEEMGDDAEVDAEEVSIDAGDAHELLATLDDLKAKFAELTGMDNEEAEDTEYDDEMDMDMDNMDMDMDTDDEEIGETGPNDPENINRNHGRTSELGQYMGEDDDNVSEMKKDKKYSKDMKKDKKYSKDMKKDDVEEAVSHEPGVQKGHVVDSYGKHGNKDSVKHNPDAKLPESTEFDFDLTEEDFLELEEGLRAVDVKMGGEQGGSKFAGEETNTKSPVAKRDMSDVKADPKTLSSKQDEHGDFDLEDHPNSDNLPHAGDNSHDNAEQTGSPRRSEVAKGGGLDKQKGYGEGETGSGKFAGTEKNVKSPIGSAGSRNES